MAKGKNSAALFEVIHKDKRFRAKASEAAGKTVPPRFAPALAAKFAGLWRRRSGSPALPPQQPLTQRRPAAQFRSRLHSAAKALFAPLSLSLEPAKPWLARHRSIFGGAALAILAICGVLAARCWTTAGPPPSALVAEQQLRDGPPHPAVLDIGQTAPADADLGGVSPEMAADVKTASPSPIATPIQGPTRITNLQYVLIQSYLDEKTANEALKFLNANGVACTIEHGIKGWRKDFFQIIGLEGFPRASGPAYLAYRKEIEALSNQFSPNPRSYKHFAPQAIKW